MAKHNLKRVHVRAECPRMSASPNRSSTIRSIDPDFVLDDPYFNLAFWSESATLSIVSLFPINDAYQGLA